MNKEEKRSNGRSLARFVGIIALCGAVGFFAGKLAAENASAVSGMLSGDGLRTAAVRVFPWIYIGINAILVAWAVILLRKARVLEAKSGENEELLTEADHLLSRPILLTSAASAVNIFMLSVFLELIISETTGPAFKPFWGTAVIVLYFLFFLCIFLVQNACIKETKRINPEKKGNLYDINFRKNWESSCDEGEKLLMYKAAFKAFRVTSGLCMTLWVVSLLAQIIFHTGIFPAVCLCLVYLVMIITYSLEGMKLERGE